MKEALTKRRQDLQEQQAKGRQRLAELEESAQALRQSLLRIEGAIQVIDETLADEAAGSPAD